MSSEGTGMGGDMVDGRAVSIMHVGTSSPTNLIRDLIEQTVDEIFPYLHCNCHIAEDIGGYVLRTDRELTAEECDTLKEALARKVRVIDGTPYVNV